MEPNYLKQAFAALLRGDTAERDRLCELALKELEAQEQANTRIMTLKPTDHLTPQ